MKVTERALRLNCRSEGFLFSAAFDDRIQAFSDMDKSSCSGQLGEKCDSYLPIVHQKQSMNRGQARAPARTQEETGR